MHTLIATSAPACNILSCIGGDDTSYRSREKARARSMSQTTKPAPAVSVVLPTFNCRSLVARAISSVLEQDFGDLELLVVDDGSNDGSEDVIRNIVDPRLTYHRLPVNRGPSAARNFGIRTARAGLIAFHDADDLWLPS